MNPFFASQDFFTRKLIESAIDIASGKRDSVSFGNLDVRRDFGYAPDYIKAMSLMLKQENPEDFLICTGKSVALRDIVEHIFKSVGASWMLFTSTNHCTVQMKFLTSMVIPPMRL